MPALQKPILEHAASLPGREGGDQEVPTALPPDEVIREHAYLVSRGVRAIGLVGHCTARPLDMLKVATRIETLADSGTIPFVIERPDGVADVGFAAAAWALDLYEWLLSEPAVPENQAHRIVGMLLGYAPDAIRRFEEEKGGRRFDPPAFPLRRPS